MEVRMLDRSLLTLAVFAAGLVIERRFSILQRLGIGILRPLPPQASVKSFVFEYRILYGVHAVNIPGELQQGQGDIDTHIGPHPCRLVVNPDGDPTGTAPPRAVSAGTPGQLGYNVSAITINPQNIAYGQPEECNKLQIEEIVAYIGGRQEALALRQQTRFTGVLVRIAGGASYSGIGAGANSWFRGMIINDLGNIVSGEFQFAVQESGGQSVMVGRCQFIC